MKTKRSRRVVLQIPDAEMDVLGCLWRSGRATAREIREQLSSLRPMAHGSVLTLLGRLEAKGLVSRRAGEAGNAFVFRPTRKLDSVYRRKAGDVLTRIFGGDPVSLVATLFDGRRPTVEEIEQLQAMLDELKRSGGDEEGAS